MADITDDHIKEALSVACEATRKGQSQTLGAVARNLELPDDDVFQALRAALDYMLVLGSQREGWGVFRPSIEGFGGKPYPPPLSRVPPSWFPIWARAFSCAPYAHLQARFADLLWEAKHGGKERYKWGQRAIDAYLQALDESFGEDVHLVEGVCRALDLAKQLGDKARQSTVVEALCDLVRENIEHSDIVPGITIRSLAALVDLPRAQRPEDLGDLIDTVLQDKQSLHVRLSCLGLKLMLAETDEERRDLREGQVNAHANEGRPQQDLARFIHFQNAIQLAEKHGLKDLADELQQEVGPLSEDSLQRVETEEEIPASTMEAYIGFFVGDDNLSNALRRFGGEIPSGDPAQNRALAQKLMNEFPLQSLMTNLITGDQGELVKQFQTREELEDYRSSVSVMASRLENAIRGIARNAGVNLFRDSMSGRQTGGVKALGKVLSELKDRIPEATRRYWSTLLTNPLGFDLRNKVSHGLLDHPSPEEAAILIHAACHLLVLKSQPESDGQG